MVTAGTSEDRSPPPLYTSHLSHIPLVAIVDLPGRQRRVELADLLLDWPGGHSGQEGRLRHPCRQPQKFTWSRVQDDSGRDGRRERGVQCCTYKHTGHACKYIGVRTDIHTNNYNIQETDTLAVKA